MKKAWEDEKWKVKGEGGMNANDHTMSPPRDLVVYLGLSRRSGLFHALAMAPKRSNSLVHFTSLTYSPLFFIYPLCYSFVVFAACRSLCSTSFCSALIRVDGVAYYRLGLGGAASRATNTVDGNAFGGRCDADVTA